MSSTTATATTATTTVTATITTTATYATTATPDCRVMSGARWKKTAGVGSTVTGRSKRLKYKCRSLEDGEKRAGNREGIQIKGRSYGIGNEREAKEDKEKIRKY